MGILALAATIVLINAPTRRSEARSAATEFSGALTAAIDDAVVAGGVHRLEVTADKWRIARFEDEDWKDFRRSDTQGAVQFSIEVEEAAESNISALTGERPQQRGRDEPSIISIDPFGDTPAFSVQFRSEQESWTVRHNEQGDITTERG